MLDTSEKDLWVSAQEYDRLIVRLAQVVHESGWKFDQILCLARGGLRPGDVLSRIFEKPLAILSTSSYRENAGTVQGRLDIARSITITKGELGGRVLLVDDLVDSGVTLEQVQRQLRVDFPAVSEIRSAVIWYKACSVVRPDFYVDYLPSNPWIHQPFEDFDTLRPEQLAAWLANGK